MASVINSNTLIHSLKIILMSSGVLFIAILISLSLQHFSFSFSLSSDFPTLWSSLRSWLRPPYLYVIINGIIITIAATSRLHHNHHHHHHHAPMSDSPTHAPPISKPVISPVHHHQQQHDVISVVSSPYDVVSVADNNGSYYGAVSVKDVEVVGPVVGFEEREINKVVEEVMKTTTTPLSPAVEVVREIHEVDEREEDVLLSTVVEESTWSNPITPTTPPARAAPLARQRPVGVSMSSERPPASSRFGHHRRPAKATPANKAEGGKALRVAKSKRHDTLESTWKAITEGRHIPLTSRHHKTKSDGTWENQGRQINLLDDDFPQPVTKSETFKDRTNQTSPAVPSSKLRKEPSLSHDDLNRRVEAFIHKFNQDMRLQREQSLQQFMEKINRGV